MEFSLLYPTDAPNKGDDTVYITDAMGDFGLYSFFATNFPVEKYLTKDPKVIRYRQDLFSDFMTISSLNFTFRKGAEQLEIVKELRQFRDGREDNESRLYAIKEIETYLDLISILYENLRTVRDKLTSAALLSFLKKIEEIQSSEYFQSLKSGVEKLSFSVKQVRSLTIGVNLDATLMPYEAGIIAVNSEYYHSGDIVSRFMRGEKNNSMMTIAPLAAGTSRFLPVKEREALLISINNAVSKIVESGLRSWRHMLRQYFHDKNITFFLNLLEEIKLILCCVEVIEQLREKNLPLCIPEVRGEEEKCFKVQKLYNPVIGFKIKETDSDEAVVENDISFDESGSLFILTGPNRGGKSVFLNAVGISQLLLQLGLPVPAREAIMSPVTGIYTHFPNKNGNVYGKGRFGEECARLQQILQKVDANSMILLDETLSGTDAYEASLIGKEVLTGLAIIGVRGVFSTHLHSLAQMKDEINSDSRIRARVDTLTMGIERGKRTYKVQRILPDGNSYARDISDKYGLFVDKILEDNKAYQKTYSRKI